jgi:Ca-activated chloride channel homolog
MKCPAFLALAALLLLVGGVVSPAQAPAVRIEEPGPGRYVSGLVTLRARVEPEGAPVVRLTFAADGQPVCAREAPPWECAWDGGQDVVAHSIRAVAVLADGSRVVDSVRTEASGFAPVVDVEVVQVAATVTDGKGRLVKGLGRDAFRVFEDGRPQEVTHFIGEDAERELVVAVDMSGSMGPAMVRCREAVKRFLASMRPRDAVTVLAFNDSVFTVSRRDATPEARLRAVDRLRSWGSTAFYDAVLKGLDLLEKHRGRRALVLFTDGEDMVSHATAQDVQRRIEVSASPVYVVAQGKGIREPGLKGVLDRVAGVSGGRAFYTDTVDKLDSVFAEIGEDIAAQYLLAYAPAESARDGSWRTIRVEVAGTKHAVRAREGYRATARGR